MADEHWNNFDDFYSPAYGADRCWKQIRGNLDKFPEALFDELEEGHFGDFDLAGINIYLTEFYRHLGPKRSAFFVPADIEQRLSASGSRERYQAQFERFGKMEVPDARLGPLVQLIHRYQKGYDQEGYVE